MVRRDAPAVYCREKSRIEVAPVLRDQKYPSNDVLSACHCVYLILSIYLLIIMLYMLYIS